MDLTPTRSSTTSSGDAANGVWNGEQLPATTAQIPRENLPNKPVSGGTTQEFSLFPFLPTEVRLQIIHAMFPGPRHICLDAEFPWTFNYEPNIHAQNLQPLPSTLFVNRESRSETLKHYSVVFKLDSGVFKDFAPFRERPFVVNPSIDSVFVTFGSFSAQENPHFQVWMRYLCARLPDGDKAIQSLEIRDMNWDSPLSSWLSKESSTSIVDRLGKMQWFRGLKSLCFTYSQEETRRMKNWGGQYWRPTLSTWNLTDHEASVQEWYEKRVRSGAVVKAPNIQVRWFRKAKWTALNME